MTVQMETVARRQRTVGGTKSESHAKINNPMTEKEDGAR